MNSRGVAPVATVLNQKLVQRQIASRDGEKRTESYLERDVLAMTCTNDLRLLVLEAKIKVQSPVASKFRQDKPLAVQPLSRRETYCWGIGFTQQSKCILTFIFILSIFVFDTHAHNHAHTSIRSYVRLQFPRQPIAVL